MSPFLQTRFTIYKNEGYFEGIVDYITKSSAEDIYEIKDELFDVLERGII